MLVRRHEVEAQRAQPGELISENVLKTMLEDAIDMTLGPLPSPYAHMVTDAEPETDAEHTNIGEEPQEREIAPPDVETVNTDSDPRIFALLDDGCNKTCHSKDWRIKADVKLKNMNMKSKQMSTREKTFTGIGDVKTCLLYTSPSPRD